MTSAPHYNPFSQAVQFNPYPTYRRLRDEAPVYMNDELGFCALSRHDDVVDALLDPVTFSSATGNSLEGLGEGLDVLMSKDPPDHTAHRRLVSRIFAPRHVAALEPSIRRVVRELLDRVREADEIDIVGDFSAQLPLWVISELLGIPVEVRSVVEELSHGVLDRPEATPDGTRPSTSVDAMAGLTEVLGDVVRRRRADPGDDLLTSLITTPVVDVDGNESHLSDDQVVARVVELAIAGHETVTRSIASGVVALDWYPDQRHQLVEDPALLPDAVEEMVRWDTPASFVGRWTTRKVELHDSVVPAETRVLLLVASATHDDRIYDEPELFDIHRRVERQLGFGLGAHLCLGAPLARLEMRIAFAELLARYPAYEVGVSGAVRADTTMVRGLRHLPVVLGPRAKTAPSGG